MSAESDSVEESMDGRSNPAGAASQNQFADSVRLKTLLVSLLNSEKLSPADIAGFFGSTDRKSIPTGGCGGLFGVTIRRAKDAVDVVSRKSGMEGGWMWELDEGAQRVEHAHK
jgi:hypothetical protein